MRAAAGGEKSSQHVYGKHLTAKCQRATSTRRSKNRQVLPRLLRKPRLCTDYVNRLGPSGLPWPRFDAGPRIEDWAAVSWVQVHPMREYQMLELFQSIVSIGAPFNMVVILG